MPNGQPSGTRGASNFGWLQSPSVWSQQVGVLLLAPLLLWPITGQAAAQTNPVTVASEICLTEGLTANNFADQLLEREWSPATLTTIPDFGRLWGDFTLVRSLFIEGTSDLPEADRHSYYRSGRQRLIEREIDVFISFQLHEAEQRRKSELHYLVHPATGIWVSIAGTPSGTKCTILSPVLDSNPALTFGNLDQDHPFNDYVQVFAEVSSPENRSINFVIKTAGIAYFTGEQSNLIQVVQIDRPEVD